MILERTVNVAVIVCAVVLVAGLALSESVSWLIPAAWFVTTPLAAWTIVQVRNESFIRKRRIVGWWLGLVYLPAALIGITSACLADAMEWPNLPDPLIPIALMVTLMWPAILIIFLYFLKWSALATILSDREPNP